METEIKRILGILLIVVGLGMFFWDLSESYYYFTAKKEFPQVFIQPVAQKTTGNQSAGSAVQDQINALVAGQLDQQIKQLMPQNAITEFLNLTAWSVFATLFIYASIKLMGVGREFWKDAREPKTEPIK